LFDSKKKIASLIDEFKFNLKCGELVKNLKTFSTSLFDADEAEAALAFAASSSKMSLSTNEQELSQLSDNNEDEENQPVIVQSRYSLRTRQKAEDALKEIELIATDDDEDDSEMAEDEDEARKAKYNENDDFNFDYLFDWIKCGVNSYSIDAFSLVN
jgi:hypothetical protein